MNDEEPILYFIPSLVATLLNREKAAGRPLTEAEVVAIRDACPCVAMHPEVAQSITESRDYEDIDPEHCWEVWQTIRYELHQAKPPT